MNFYPRVWIERKGLEEPLSVLLTHYLCAYPFLSGGEGKEHAEQYLSLTEANHMVKAAVGSDLVEILPEGYAPKKWRAHLEPSQGWQGQELIRGEWVIRFTMRWTDGLHKQTEEVVEYECKRLVECWNKEVR